MTILKHDRPVARETAVIYRGRPLMIMLHPQLMELREKGKHTRVTVPIAAIWDLGWKLKARQEAAEKPRLGKQRR